jgi:hypothetical protein
MREHATRRDWLLAASPIVLFWLAVALIVWAVV